MGPSHSSSVLLLSLLILTFFLPSTPLPSAPPPPPPLSPPLSPSLSHYIACKSTLYPKLCRSILSTIHSSPSDPYHYGKFSVKECKKQAKRTSNLINRFLTQTKQSFMSQLELRALQDCNELSQLNVDFLETISAELNSADSLPSSLVDRVQSLLSAIVTNQETCFDGLEDSGSKIYGALRIPLSNTTELYSVSLGLVSHALSRGKRKRRGGKPWENSVGKTNLFESDSGLAQAFMKAKVVFKIGGLYNAEPAWPRRMKLDEQSNEDNSTGILVNNSVTVSKNGNGNFTTIESAIAFAPNNTKMEDGYFVIFVTEGIYEDEYIVVPKNKKHIMLIGDGINRTIISGNRSFIDGWTTYNSATFAVGGEGFVAIDITFRNTAGPEKHQAVAVRNNADLSTFYRCSFEGYQDTLYAHSLRQFYRECDIYGTVDFIFGNSASVFQNCNLIARKPMPKQKNAITAQGRTDPNQNTGISIHNCTIIASPSLAQDLNSTSTYLGRPWKEYSRTVIMQTFIDDLIDEVGWLEWNGSVGISTLYYGEYENYGRGANTSMRVEWPGYKLMDSSEALNFTVYNFTMGDTWLPFTDIPFSMGLV